MPKAIRTEPAYLDLARQGELLCRAERARECLTDCQLCGQHCGVDRTAGELGICQTGAQAWVFGHYPHFGEEAPLVGFRGSGTIFFSWCNLRCQFCQNYELSHDGEGSQVTAGELAIMMTDLQDQGCHNINLVSPSHVVPMILEALVLAVNHGLRLPLVFNTGGYDSLETLQLLDGVVDIYMPDMKCADPKVGQRLTGAKDYPAVNRQAVKEMHRQVGDLVIDAHGIARHGLIVRHLVLPGGLAGTAESAAFLADEISRNTYLNLMDQYRPCYSRQLEAGLKRRVNREEMASAYADVHRAGLTRLAHIPAVESQHLTYY